MMIQVRVGTILRFGSLDKAAYTERRPAMSRKHRAVRMMNTISCMVLIFSSFFMMFLYFPNMIP